MNLVAIKDKIESLSRSYHLEIARLLFENNANVNENQNGIFVNLSLLDSSLLEKIVQYIAYIELQECQLSVDETSKGGLKENFFQSTVDGSKLQNERKIGPA
jgi:hypothetical protein